MLSRVQWWRILATLLALLALAAQVTSDDPQVAQQWALSRIDAPCAWEITRGTDSVTVAVIDSGVDFGHPDLVGRLRDDGYDFVEDDDVPNDENGHGTNVAGVVAAVAGNGEGIAGLAPLVKILPIKVMDAEGYGDERLVAAGVRFAADRGVQIINISLGASLRLQTEQASQQLTEAITYAQQHGVLVIVAAGNDFVAAPNVVAASNPDVLVVAASDPDDRKAPFSNYGSWIDVVAPGVGILSTMPTYEVFLTRASLPSDRRFQQNYDYMSGTSQATPYVSALAALLFAIHPDWTANQVADQIRASTDDIADANAELVAQDALGSGRINACAALGGTPVAAPASIATNESMPWPLILLLASAAMLLLGTLFLARRRIRPQERQPLPAVAADEPPTDDAWGWLEVVAGQKRMQRIRLNSDEVSIGRDEDCDVTLLDDPSVSRRHLRLLRAGGRAVAEDLGATHGTYLNGRRLNRPAILAHGDILTLGATQLRILFP